MMSVKCNSCGELIQDQICLHTKDGLYHLNCLKCKICSLELSQANICYNRDGNIYCKQDYQRLFQETNLNQKKKINFCATCGKQIELGEYIMSIKNNKFLFHLNCFKCSICNFNLQTGEQFLFTCSSKLYCKLHLKHSMQAEVKREAGLVDGALKCKKNGENKRNRTLFKHAQVKQMRMFFNSNQNPDSNQLKQLSSHTGLSKRVLQVWFQNARAKWRKNFLQQTFIGPLVVEEAKILCLNQQAACSSQFGDDLHTKSVRDKKQAASSTEGVVTKHHQEIPDVGKLAKCTASN